MDNLEHGNDATKKIIHVLLLYSGSASGRANERRQKGKKGGWLHRVADARKERRGTSYVVA